ncbi:MAG: DUF3108 domain-containing protein [Gallionellaceae bacterium]|jgi:hypothetical protein
MKRIIPSCFAVSLLVLIALPAQAELPSKIQSSFDVIGFGMTLANIEETFTRDNDNYHIESVTKAVGMLARFKPETIRIISSGKITTKGLVPLSFSLKREVDKDKNASVKFNWDNSVMIQTDYKGVTEIPLSKGTQDRLSVSYNLQILAKSGLTDFSFTIIDGNNQDDYVFTLSPDVHNTRVPLGNFKSRFISNTPVSTEVKYEIWMATERDDFPCKLIVTDSSGGKLTQVLTGLTIVP